VCGAGDGDVGGVEGRGAAGAGDGVLGRGGIDVIGGAGRGGGGGAGRGAGGAAGRGAIGAIGATGLTAAAGATAAGAAAAGFLAGAFFARDLAFTDFLADFFAVFFAAFFAGRFLVAALIRLFFRAGAAFFVFLVFLAFFAFDFFAMIDLPIVRLPTDRAPPAVHLGSCGNCDRLFHPIRPNARFRPYPLASSAPPAPGRRSPSRSARPDGQPEFRCPPRSA
jgi:hypothetical protein